MFVACYACCCCKAEFSGDSGLAPGAAAGDTDGDEGKVLSRYLQALEYVLASWPRTLYADGDEGKVGLSGLWIIVVDARLVWFLIQIALVVEDENWARHSTVKVCWQGSVER